MEDVNLVLESLKFMVLGMGIVFIFLIIMVFALKLQAKLIAKYFPLEEKTQGSQWKPQTASSQAQEKQTIAAITAAIIHFNKQKGK